MNTILTLLVLLGTGFFAFMTLILAEHKEEIFKDLKGKDDDN